MSRRCPATSVGAVPGAEPERRARRRRRARRAARSRDRSRTRSMPGGGGPGTATRAASPSALRIDAHPQRQRGVGAVVASGRACAPDRRGRSTPRRARAPVKPTNQASVLSLVVPVLPAAGRPSARAAGRGAALRRRPPACRRAGTRSRSSISGSPARARRARRDRAGGRRDPVEAARRIEPRILGHGARRTARRRRAARAPRSAARPPSRGARAPRNARASSIGFTHDAPSAIGRTSATSARDAEPRARARSRAPAPTRSSTSIAGALSDGGERVLREHDAAEPVRPSCGFQWTFGDLVVFGDRRVAQRACPA